MALLFMEGFDGYADLNGPVRRSDVTRGENSPASWGALQAGRINGEAFEAGYRVHYIFHLPQTSTATQWVNFAFRASTAPTSNSTIFRVYDTNNAVMWSLYFNITSKTISVVRGTSTILGTSTTVIGTLDWTSIGVEVFADDTVGTVKLWMNGQLELDLTGQDTKGGSSAVTNYVTLGSTTQSGQDLRFDDFIFGDDSGTDLTAHPGDCHIEMILPDGDGTTNDWTAVGTGTTNADRVDEDPTDNSTTYVYSSTATDKDLYTFADLTETANTVYAVQVKLYARKEGAGFREINHTLRSNVTEVDGPATALSTTYQWLTHFEENDPDGGGAWDEAAVNALQAGIELQT